MAIPVKRNYSIDDKRAVEVLTEAFADNRSVNYVIKQDRHRLSRIRRLMQYALATSRDFDDVWQSADRQAYALTVLPHRKKVTTVSVRRDASLAFAATGWQKVYAVLRREARIKALHPQEPFCHLWFVSVAHNSQGRGLGSLLLQELVDCYEAQQLPIYLETSTLRNVPWYERFVFKVYDELNFTYPLYMMRRLINY